MPDNKITLFAQSPVQIGSERYFEEEFEVDTQKQADELIACGAAVDPKAIAKALDNAEQDEAKKAEAEKAAAEKAAAEKAAAEKAEAEKAAAEKVEADKKVSDISQAKGKGKGKDK